MEKKKIKLHNLTFQPYLSEATIQERVQALGKELVIEYKDKNPLFVAILNGAFIFAADLVREFNHNCELTFVKLKSYAGLESTVDIMTRIGLETEVSGRHIIIVEDIVDTGNTMYNFLLELNQLKPLSISIASLLVKPDALLHPIDIKYIGFNIPTDFVIGYGLDYDGLGRNYKDIYQLEK